MLSLMYINQLLITMKHLNFIALAGILILSGCKESKKEDTEANKADSTAIEIKKPQLIHQWTTDTLLTTSESVIYDTKRDILYISNIAGKPDSLDGKGFISKVNLMGKITDTMWVEGLNAPKGMGIIEDTLYVNDINNVVKIDIETGEILKKYPVENSEFLNDITTNNGKVYMSDSNKGTIHMLENDKISIVKDSLASPNGLLADNGQLLVALWNDKTLNTLDPSTGEITLRTEGIENPDGIVALGDGSYLVSSWNGKIHLVNSDWSKELILDTTADEVSAADIEYISDKNLLLVPNFFKNTVSAYKLEK